MNPAGARVAASARISGCGIAVLGTLALLFVGMLSVVWRPVKRSGKVERPALTAEQSRALDAVVASGVLRIDGNFAWIQPAAWHSVNAQHKQGLCAAIARRDPSGWMIMHDGMSGKKLAKYSESWGFEVY